MTKAKRTYWTYVFDVDYQTCVAGTGMAAGQPVTIRRRTWRERLLSWPWRPWVAFQAVPVLPLIKDAKARTNEAVRKNLETELFKDYEPKP